MHKKRVLYYVQTYYFDSCLETLKALKDLVELHLIIEVSPDSKNATILKFDDLKSYKNLDDLENAIEKYNFKKLSTFIEGLHSVKLLTFKAKRSSDPRNFRNGMILVNYIRQERIDIIHFDGQSVRLIYILPLLAKKNIYLTIHDPVQHSGEENWKTNWVRKAYSRISNKIFFYSNFAKKQYIDHNTKQNKRLYNIPLKPYQYISTYRNNEIKEDQYILFFGRISRYKGIDILIESVRLVLLKYPNEQFIIAGNFRNNIDLLNKIKVEKNLNVINKHVEIEELAEIISKSKFIVCPYRDATQSGVLMTSFAMDKPVIATNVGSFPEYIEHEVNGLLSKPNHIDFAEQIISALNNDRYKIFGKNIKNSKKSVEKDIDTLKNAYEY